MHLKTRVSVPVLDSSSSVLMHEPPPLTSANPLPSPVSNPSTRRPPSRSRLPTTHPRGTVPIKFARLLAPHLDNAIPSAGDSSFSWCEYSGSDQSWVKGSTQARSRQLTRGDSSIGLQLYRVTPRRDQSKPMRVIVQNVKSYLSLSLIRAGGHVPQVYTCRQTSCLPVALLLPLRLSTVG